MKSKTVKQAVRQQYSAEFKRQAVLQSDRAGVTATAMDLGLRPNQIYAWRAKRHLGIHAEEDQQLMQAENSRLKRELARLSEEHEFLKKAAAYFAKSHK
jgi:transposase